MALPLVHFVVLLPAWQFCGPPIHPLFPPPGMSAPVQCLLGRGMQSSRLHARPPSMRLGSAGAVLHPLQSDDLGSGFWVGVNL